MANKLETIQILFVKRNARKRGRTSSDDYNDMIDELAHDLARFNTQWNNSLVSLTSAIPDGTVDSSIDAFTNGLSGRHLYADAISTSTYNPTYYNAASGRPYSILEQFTQVYGTIQSTRNDLSAEIQASIPTAENIIISDAGGYYSASNVEDALAEIKTSVNNIELGNLDLSAVAQHYVPLNDNTWDIGNSLKRVRDLYLGPSSLNIIALSAESEAPSDKTYSFRVNSGDGVLELYETGGAGTVIARFGTTGTTFPAGGGGNIPLNDLTNVVVPSPSAEDFLRYDGANWVNDTIEINDLTNVNTSSPSVAEFLRFDGSNWVNDTATLSGLADVLASNPSTFDFLRFNGSSWDNDTAELNDLTDVAIPSPVNLHVLMHNGVNWGSKQLAINEISGIAITPGSLTDHAFLVYDGTYWRNKTALGSVLLDAGVAGPTSVSAGQGIVSVLNNSALGRTVLTFKDDQGTTHQLADDITQNFTVTNFLSVGSNNSPTTSGYELEVKSSEDAKIFVEGNRDNTGDGDASIIFARDGNYGSLGVFENGQVYGEELGGILDHIDNAIILHAGNASDNASIQLANNGYSRISLTASGQVGIHENDPAPLAALDVRGWWTDTPGGTSYYGGLLVPRLTGGIRLSNLASAPDGSVIYTTDENKFWGMVNGVWTDLGNQGVSVTGTPTPGDLTYFDSSNSITNKNGFSFSGDLLSLDQITVASGLFGTMNAQDGIKLGPSARTEDGVIKFDTALQVYDDGWQTLIYAADIINPVGNPPTNAIAIWQNASNLKYDVALNWTDNRLETTQAYISSGLFDQIDVGQTGLVIGENTRTETGGLRYTGGSLQVYDGGWNDINQGDVTKVGTPVNTRVAFWSGNGILDHHEDFVFTDPVAGKKQLSIGTPSTVGIGDTAATLIVGDHTNGPQLVLVTPFGDSFTQPFEMYHKTSFGTRDEIIWTTDEGSTRTKYASIMMDTFNMASGSRLVLRNASDNAGTMNNGLVLFENGNTAIGYSYTSPIGNFPERLSINGGVELGAALGTANGTLQYDNGTIEGRIGGSWVDLAAATTAAGSDNEIQFNTSNNFSSSSKLKWYDSNGVLAVSGILQLQEQSDPPSHSSNYGYLWVKDDNPSTLWFTNDFGGDYQLGNSSPPAGSTQDLQYNNNGVFAAASGVEYIDGSTKRLFLDDYLILTLAQRSTPPANFGSSGSIWVQDTVPTKPWFTDNGSADLPFMLADNVGTNNQIPVWTNTDTLEADDNFTFSSGALQVSGVNATLGLQSSNAGCLIRATGGIVYFNVLTDHTLNFVNNDDYTAANQASMYQGKLFLGGNAAPTERLEVNGAIKIGDATSTDNGTVRWTGTDFEGRKAGAWVSLTDIGVSTPAAGNAGEIQFNNGSDVFTTDPKLFYWDTQDVLFVGDRNGHNGPTTGSHTIVSCSPISAGIALWRSDADETIINGDYIGYINWYAEQDGNSLKTAAISVIADGTWTVSGTNQAPSKMIFGLQDNTTNSTINDPILSLYPDQRVVLGDTVSHLEMLNVNGAIAFTTTGSNATNNGTIKWTGSDFEGRVGGTWVSLTDTQIHDHSGVSQGGTISHTNLSDKGTNTHSQIDTHIGAVNPHSTELADLDDVSGSPIDGQVLTYVTTSGEWIPQTPDITVHSISSVKTSNHNAIISEVVRCDPSGGAFTVTLPTAVGYTGKTVVVKNTTSDTNIITIDTTSSQTIDGSLTTTITEAYKSLTFVSYGDNWGII